MQQVNTVAQRMMSGVRRLPAAVRRGGEVGVLAGLLLLPLSVGAVESGDLDTSFGGDGTVLTNFGSGSYDVVEAVALQPDGKIVVAGSSEASGNRAFTLARYLSNGTLDASFGGNGTVTTAFGSNSVDEAYALALQPNGKIVVAGGSNINGNMDFAVARYLPNGTLDPSFSGDGTVLTNFGSGSGDTAFAVALQSDGKIVVAGYSEGKFALARYLPNGTLDPSFGGNGTVTTDFGSGSYAVAQAVALQLDGKIVVAGHFQFFNGNWDFALARYLPNGTLDATFSGDGRVLTDFGSGRWDTASAVAVQPNGKIVVAGTSFLVDPTGPSDFALARYLPNGTLDATFNGDGRVLTDFESDDHGAALALQPNGKIVVAGSSAGNFALARYLPTGTLDTTFSGDGIVTTDFDGTDSFVTALAIQPRDGRLVVAGVSYANGSGDFALARYHAITCTEEEESSTAWQNVAFAPQAQPFTALFDAVPHQLRMDGVTGLALGPADAYTDLGAIVRFNPSGVLDARNGSVYQAARAMPYTTGLPYHVRMVVNVPQHTYSVYVTPDGGTEQTLATNYAFRTEQRTVPRLDTWALYAASGRHTVCNFALGASSSPAWQNVAFAPQAQTFTALFDAVPHQNRMDGVTGLALGPADAYTDLGAIVRFNPSGFFDARNGSAYQAAQAIPYTAGMRYAIRLDVDVPQHTYSVYVTPDGGEEQVLATNYAFRTEQYSVPRLDTWVLHVESGSHTVSNFILE